MRKLVDEAVSYLKNAGIESPETGIILGTGLGKLVDEIEIENSFPYSTIPHFPLSTVETHEGKLISGKLSGKNVLVMQGRFHYYEGYSMQQITFPLYVMRELGIRQLLISNAAGNLNLNWKKGELMLITDHINLLPENPLRGKNDSYFGPRFPDMSRPYDHPMIGAATEAAVNRKIVLRKGDYVAVQGPNLETAAEYRFLRKCGADAVGMSTVPEVIVANYLGIRVCAISVLTDDCDPDNLKPVNISEIIEIAGRAEDDLSVIFKSIAEKLT